MPQPDQEWRNGRRFIRPEELTPLLDEVVGQETLKVKLASAFSQFSLYLEGVDDSRPTVLVYGPSGSGKTYAVEKIVRGLEEMTGEEMPYTIVSSASLSPPSYKGQTLREVLVQHWLEYETDEGVIFLDEIDKWCKTVIGSDTESVSMGIRQQAEILKFLERDRLSFIDDSKDIEALQKVSFDTSRIMWVLAGAFTGLDKVIKARLHNVHFPAEEVWQHALPEDFIRYGLLPELANRIGTWAWVRPLERTQIVEILRTQELPRWQRRFDAIGCAIDLQEGALVTCANLGYETRTGARGAASLLRRSLDDIFVEASRAGAKQVSVDSHAIRVGQVYLESA